MYKGITPSEATVTGNTSLPIRPDAPSTEKSANQSGTQDLSAEQSRDLVSAVIAQEPRARQQLVTLVHPMIDFQTDRYCRRFCQNNQHQTQCTLTPPMRAHGADMPLCEWGNASYGWMLEELTSNKRLEKYAGKEGAGIRGYLFTIVNSLPFYERWKDWRFGRRVHVPTYVQALGDSAHKVFFALRAGDSIPIAAQKSGLSEAETESLARQIIVLLTEKNRLHLLDPPTTLSMTQVDSEEDETQEMELAVADTNLEQWQEQGQVRAAWQQLTPIEQFVLEALVIDQQEAADVLHALKVMRVSIKEGVAPDATNRQQLYYFKRKALAKLAEHLEA